MELIIDNRETIKDYFQDKDYVKIKNLDIGDYIFKYNDKDILIIDAKLKKIMQLL